MAINWVAMAISAALAVGSAVVSARAAAVTQRNVSRALIRGMDEQDEIDRKQREVVKALLPEVDQSAQDQFLTEEDKKIAASMAKTSKAGKKSRQTDIAIAGKLTSFKGERRASKKESEARYAEKRFHLARFLAPNAVALYLDPKINESASSIREYGVQKGAAGRIANIDAQWQSQNSAGGLKALSTALSVASTLVAVGWGTTADAAVKTTATEGAKQAAIAGGIEGAKTAATQSALGISQSAGSKAAFSTLSGATQLPQTAASFMTMPEKLAVSSGSLFGNKPFPVSNYSPAFSPPDAAAKGTVADWSLGNPDGTTPMGIWDKRSPTWYQYPSQFFPKPTTGVR